MKVCEIPVVKAQPDPQQPRKTIAEAELKELTGSIERRGLLQPLIVFANDDGFVVIDGHRRLMAMERLGAEFVPAVVLVERPSDDQLLLTQLTTSMLRVDLTPMEQAEALQRIQTMNGWSNTEIASQLQFSKTKVTRLLSLLKLPEKARELVRSGELKPSTAYEISRAKDLDECEQLIAAATSEKGLRRDEAQQTVKRRTGKNGPPVRFRLSVGEILVTSSSTIDLACIEDACRELVRECQRAKKSGLNVGTLSRVLKDRHTSNVTEETSHA